MSCVSAIVFNRQLAELRKGMNDQQSGSSAAVVEAEKKLIICAVKKPVKLSESPDGEKRVSHEFFVGVLSGRDSTW